MVTVWFEMLVCKGFLTLYIYNMCTLYYLYEKSLDIFINISRAYILYFNTCEYNIYMKMNPNYIYIYRKCYIHIILHINALKQNGTSYAKN